MCSNRDSVWIGHRNVHTFISQKCHCGLKQGKLIFVGLESTAIVTIIIIIDRIVYLIIRLSLD